MQFTYVVAVKRRPSILRQGSYSLKWRKVNLPKPMAWLEHLTCHESSGSSSLRVRPLYKKTKTDNKKKKKGTAEMTKCGKKLQFFSQL